jgi:hypothetical protein
MKIIKPHWLPIVILAVLPPALAQDQNPCSTSSIKGSYGFVSSVRLVPPPNSTVKHTARLRFVGLISYDGTGNAKAGGISIAPSGKTSPFTGDGTYSVDAQHCTGSVSFQQGENNKAKWDFVIVSNGSELLTMVETDPNSSPFTQVKR